MLALADLPELVGFFSYSREDDEGSRGALSALRDAIQRELSAQLGRSKSNFRLWQDNEAIAPVKLWELEIAAAIAQSVFFIPMVTPRVMRSKHCKFEFESFLAQERALDRSDLVFPILYMNVAALEDERQWRNDPLLSIVGKRQYVDWRPFRHLDVHSTTVREAVERFCSKIVAALDAPVAAIPATEPAGSGRAAALDAQPANEAKEAQRQAEKQRKEREEREMQERARTEEIRSQQEARRAAEERAAREAERTRQQEAARNAEAERQRQDAARAAERKRNAAQAAAQAAEKDAAVAMPATSAPGAGEPSILQRAFAHPIVRGAAMPLLVLLAWEVAAATGAISTLFLPSPTGVLAEWFRRILSGELLIATATTLARLAGGVLIGFALALAFSRLFVNLPRLRDFTLPLLRFLHAIPPVSYLPLLIIPFGSGPIVGIAATAIAAFFVLLLHSEGKEAPGAAAQVLPTLRLGIGLTVIFCVTLASELLTESGGLGHVAAVSEQQMNAAGIFSSILTAALVVLAIHFVTRTRIAQTSWVGLVREQASMPRDSKLPPRSLIWRAAEIAAVPVVLILSWQILASLRGDPLVLPGPVEVISTNSAELMGNAAITVTQLLAVFSLGVLPALLLSKLMQARPPLAGVLLPFLRACTNVPGVLLLPVAVLWFGLGNASAIFAAVCGTFFPVVMELVERRSLSAAVLAGLRLAFLLVIAGELFLGNGGLGYLMMRGVGVLNMPLLLAPILAAGIIGLLLEGSARLTLSRIART